MPTPAVQRVPGDFSYNVYISTSGVKTFDITNIVTEISFFESLSNTFLTAEIKVFDSSGFLESIPIIGHETIEIDLQQLGVPENIFTDIKFSTYKISEPDKISDRGVTYTIYLVSQELITDLKTKVQKTYFQTSITNIVKNIHSDFLLSTKPITVQETKYLQNFTIPSWSPSRTLQFLSNRSIPLAEDGTGSCFFFYETLKGFNFLSIEKLISDSINGYSPKVYVDQPKNTAKDVQMKSEEDQFVMNSYRIENLFDTSKNIVTGLYSSTLETYDVTRMKRNQQVFVYGETTTQNERVIIDNFTHLEGNKLLPETVNSFFPNANRNFYPTTTGQDSLSHIPTPELSQHPEEWLLQRKSQLQQLTTVNILASVPGNIDRFVGEVVELDIPSFSVTENEQRNTNTDRYYSGRYIIMELRHRFAFDDYTTEMVLSKDSLVNQIQVDTSV